MKIGGELFSQCSLVGNVLNADWLVDLPIGVMLRVAGDILEEGG